MSSVHIVTDSSARFADPAFHHKHPVTLAPVVVRSGSQSLIEDPTLRIHQAEHLFQRGGQIPVTQAPSVEKIMDIYRDLQEKTHQIISIHSAPSVSSSYANALRASESFLGRCDIQVINSMTMSAGLGLLVQKAVEASQRNASFDEIIHLLRSMIPRLYLVLFLNDLTYLERNGLVSRSQAILGNMLGIIPFLTIENGELIPMEKVRSRPRALEKIIEFVTEFSDIERLVILRDEKSTAEEAEMVSDRIRSMYSDTPIDHLDYGPSVGTLIGTEGLGVVVLESEEESL